MTKNSKLAKATMEQMYTDRPETGDVTFIVDSERIRVHRCVLAAFSAKYKAQFYGPNPDDDEIEVADVSAEAFNEFLQFFYLETVNLSMQNIEAVLNLAKQSLVVGFVNDCCSYLMKMVSIVNLCSCYRLALLYDIKPLQNHCERLFTSQTMEIFGTNDFIQCDRDVLLEVVKMDSLNCRETDVFSACISWARAACEQKGLDNGQAENLRAEFGDAIYQIRFASMNVDEFAVLHKSNEGLFTCDEMVEILYMIGNLKDFKSNRFNQKPRTLRSQMECAVHNLGTHYSLLECNRMKNPDEFECAHESFNTKPTYIENFVNCNKPIRLHGFAIGAHLTDHLHEFREMLRIFVAHKSYGTWRELLNLTQPKCSVGTTNKETVFMLEQPVDLKVPSQTTFTFYLPIPKLQQPNALKIVIDVGDIMFQIRGDWITRLFFDKL